MGYHFTPMFRVKSPAFRCEGSEGRAPRPLVSNQQLVGNFEMRPQGSAADQFTYIYLSTDPWRHHSMGTLSALLALSEGNPPLTGGSPHRGPMIRSLGIFSLLSACDGVLFLRHYDRKPSSESTAFKWKMNKLNGLGQRHNDVYFCGRMPAYLWITVFLVKQYIIYFLHLNSFTG